MNVKNLILVVCVLCNAVTAAAQISFDRMVHDFGDISVNVGAVSCTFKFSNPGKEDLLVTSVVPSCGCTDVKWTRSTIKPGGSGTITATYSNDEGPGYFDKTLTVYVKEAKKPQVLHIRGTVNEKKLSVGEAFPIHFGPLGFKFTEYKGGNISQGESREGEFTVANISDKPVKLSFANVSEGLKIMPEKDVLKAHETTRVCFTVTASRKLWGKNWYYAAPVADGVIYKSKGREQNPGRTVPGGEALRSDANPQLAEGCKVIGIWAVTRENFSNISEQQRRNGPSIEFDRTTYEFGKIKAGTPLDVTFNYKTSGNEPLKIYKAECDSRLVRITQTGSAIRCSIDTSTLPKGEQLFVVSIYTNSPSRSLVTLFITGYVR